MQFRSTAEENAWDAVRADSTKPAIPSEAYALLGELVLDDDAGRRDLGDAMRLRPELAHRSDVSDAWLRVVAGRDPAA